MKRGSLKGSGVAAAVSLRRAAFLDVPSILAVIEEALEHGCRRHYDPDQRRAVFLSYARILFVDVLGPFETIVAEAAGEVVGVAQLDPRPVQPRLRALFVAAKWQRSGVGRSLLEAVERIARGRGLRRLYGEMSLNAVRFYAAAGFLPLTGPTRQLHGDIAVPVVAMEKQLTLL